MDEVFINEAMLMSSISKYPIALDETWAVWGNTVITKRMALAFLTKLHAGPLPRHMQELLYKDYSQKVNQIPVAFHEKLRDKGTYWDYHTRQPVVREEGENEHIWFSRLYGRIYGSMSERTSGPDTPNVVKLDEGYKKLAIERLFLHD